MIHLLEIAVGWLFTELVAYFVLGWGVFGQPRSYLTPGAFYYALLLNITSSIIVMNNLRRFRHLNRSQSTEETSRSLTHSRRGIVIATVAMLIALASVFSDYAAGMQGFPSLVGNATAIILGGIAASRRNSRVSRVLAITAIVLAILNLTFWIGWMGWHWGPLGVNRSLWHCW